MYCAPPTDVWTWKPYNISIHNTLHTVTHISCTYNVSNVRVYGTYPSMHINRYISFSIYRMCRMSFIHIIFVCTCCERMYAVGYTHLHPHIFNVCFSVDGLPVAGMWQQPSAAMAITRTPFTEFLETNRNTHRKKKQRQIENGMSYYTYTLGCIQFICLFQDWSRYAYRL